MATTKKHTAPVPDDATNTQKDPANWVTGDEPMTGAQKSYLKTLSDEAGQKMDDKLTKGEASMRIDELRNKQHVVDKRADNSDDGSNAQKNPSNWVTGDEPMTGAQKSYLKTLSDEAGEKFDDSLTKGEASKKIDALRHKSDRVEA